MELKEGDTGSPDEFDDIFSSPSLDECLHHATLIATLTEHFKLTSVEPIQREIMQLCKVRTHSLFSQLGMEIVFAFFFHTWFNRRRKKSVR